MDEAVDGGADRPLDGVLDGTKPRSTSPFATASSTAVIEPSGTSSAPARSGWVSRASCVKVAGGPK